jgi:hypothetical protein
LSSVGFIVQRGVIGVQEDEKQGVKREGVRGSGGITDSPFRSEYKLGLWEPSLT